jgi:hypothetical protein
MRTLLRSKAVAIPLAALLVGGILATVAYGAVTSRQVFAEGSNLSYRFERVSTDASGFDSGWHIHPGLVVVQIEAGSVQFYQGSCTARTFGPGEVIFEIPWKPARFVAAGAATWTTSFIIPAGQQLTVPQRTYSPAQPSPCP